MMTAGGQVIDILLFSMLSQHIVDMAVQNRNLWSKPASVSSIKKLYSGM